MSASGCYHCELPVADASAVRAEVAGTARVFCCAGCAAVAELISSSGLAGYYQHRDQPGERPDADDIQSNRYTLFDLPDAQAEFVRSDTEGCLRAELAVDGISCAACAWLIEHHLERQPGVRHISVNLSEHRASIRFDPQAVRLSELMTAVHRIGYRPRPWQQSNQMQHLKQEGRKALRRLGLAGLVQMQIGMLAIALYAGAFQGIETQYRDLLRWASLILCTPVVLYSAAPFFRGAWRGIRNRAPGMDLPVAIAIGLAYLASMVFTVTGGEHVYFDSVAMFTFFLLLGRYLEMQARHRAGLANGNLLSLVPAAATRITGQSSELVPVSRLTPGDCVLVRPGEAFAADGVVTDGESSVDESALTGESMPIRKGPGDPVSAGTLNVDGALRISVAATGLQSRLGNILSLVDRAASERPRAVALADRAATLFVMVVLVLAALSGLYWYGRDPARMLEIILSVLVVSCPCALSLATPTVMTAATGVLKRRGFLVTRAHALDVLANASEVVFDKTGTLSTGEHRLLAVEPLADLNAEECVAIAASLEALSSHPIASAFSRLPERTLTVSQFRNAPGHGVAGCIDGVMYRIGRPAFALEDAPTPPASASRWILLADETRAVAWIALGDTLRKEAPACVDALRASGLEVSLLSGDSAAAVAQTAAQLGIEDAQANCTPESKLKQVQLRQQRGRRVIMVGDGINDVPVLSGADVSIAMSNASDVTRANADCMLLADDLMRIPEAVTVARAARRVIKQNLVWAIGYNLTAIPFAAAGWVPPWLAAIGMSLSSLIVVANALRLRRAVTGH